MRQFFDNNRVNVGDLSRDTGLDKSDLQNFMDGITDLPVDEKMELYKWYLGKMQNLTIKDGTCFSSFESFGSFYGITGKVFGLFICFCFYASQKYPNQYVLLKQNLLNIQPVFSVLEVCNFLHPCKKLMNMT